MTKPLEIDWTAIRNQFEAGIPATRLASAHGIRANTIRVRAHREGWKLREIPATEPPPIDIPVEKQKPPRFRAGGEERRVAEGFVVLSALPAERRQAVMENILSRYTNGDNLDTLAAEHGVSRSTIYYWLLGGAADDTHAELVTAALTSRAMRADKALEEATNAVDIARAREMARFARLDLERRRPAIYGQQQRLVHDAGPGLAARLLAAQQRVVSAKQREQPVIEGQAEVIDGQPDCIGSMDGSTEHD